MAGANQIELVQHAEKIRAALGASVQNAIIAGLELSEAKSKIPHGEWGDWLRLELGMNPRTARRFIRSSKKIQEYVADADVGNLLGSKSALYKLAEKNVPPEAMEQAVETMRGGTYLTMGLAEGIIRAVEDAGQTARYLDLVSDRVANISTFHGVDPEVIPALSRLERQMPEIFDEVEASGCIYDTDGEAIPLEDANKRDIIDYVEHNRFESKMQKRVGKPLAFFQTGFKLLEIHDGYAYVQLFTVDGDGVIKDLVGKIHVKLEDRVVLEGVEWRVM